MPLIELAMEGRCEYLRAVNGIPEDEAPAADANAAGSGADLIGYLRQRAKG